MNINSRIDWRAGMELTPQTFIELDKSIARRHLAISKVANGNLFGIIPFTEFDNDGAFVRKSIELPLLKCMALLPSGEVLHIEEPVEFTIPALYGDVYYFSCGVSKENVYYENDTVPCARPKYAYGVYTITEVMEGDLLPILKFKVTNGVLVADKEYIPPYISLSSCDKFKQIISCWVEQLTILGTHPNLEWGEGKRAFMHYAFLLKNYSFDNRVRTLIQLLHEIIQAVDYYVVAPNVESEILHKECNEYDIVLWFNWISQYLKDGEEILKKVVLVETTIDLEKLKAEVKVELEEQLYPLIKEKVYLELKQELHDQITQEITIPLTEYLNGEVRRRLHDELSDELSGDLYKKLFEDLYNKLYEMLFVPEVEEIEDDFTPLM